MLVLWWVLTHLDPFTVPTISRSPSYAHTCTYLPRPLHGLDCFTVSILCTYTDLGSRGYFGVSLLTWGKFGGILLQTMCFFRFFYGCFPFIYLFIHSFLSFFIHLFIHSFIHSFIYLSIYFSVKHITGNVIGMVGSIDVEHMEWMLA